MTAQINFLRQRRKKLTAQQEQDKKYATYAGYVTIFLFGTVVVLFFVEFLMSRNINALVAEQRQIEREIVDRAEIEKEYLILGDKLAILQELVEDKGVKQDALEFFSTLFAQEDIVLSQVIFNKENLMQFDIETKDVFQYRALLLQLQSPDVLSRYPQLSVTDLSRTKTGEYTSIVTVNVSSDPEESGVEE